MKVMEYVDEDMLMPIEENFLPMKEYGKHDAYFEVQDNVKIWKV